MSDLNKISEDGFIWRILNEDQARIILSSEATEEFTVYALYPDDTEAVVDDVYALEDLIEKGDVQFGLEAGFPSESESKDAKPYDMVFDEDGYVLLTSPSDRKRRKDAYVTMNYDGNVANSALSPTGVFPTKKGATAHLGYLERTAGRNDIWITKACFKPARICLDAEGGLRLPYSNPERGLAQIFLRCASGAFPRSIDTNGCRAFYTPDEWQDREERYCLGAELIIVHDRGDLHTLLGGEDTESSGILDDLLREEGYYLEAGTDWYHGLYKCLP